MKSVSGRNIDKSDIENIINENREILDFDYINKSLEKLNVPKIENVNF